MKNKIYAFLSRVFIRISNFFAECGDWCLDRMDHKENVYLISPYAKMMEKYSSDMISGINRSNVFLMNTEEMPDFKRGNIYPVSHTVSKTKTTKHKKTVGKTNKKDPK